MTNFTSLDEALKEFEDHFPCIQCSGDGHAPIQVSDDEWQDAQCEFHGKYLDPIRSLIRSVWESAYAQKLDDQGLTASYLKGVEEGKKIERERVRKMIEGMKKYSRETVIVPGQPIMTNQKVEPKTETMRQYNKALSDLLESLT